MGFILFCCYKKKQAVGVAATALTDSAVRSGEARCALAAKPVDPVHADPAVVTGRGQG